MNRNANVNMELPLLVSSDFKVSADSCAAPSVSGSRGIRFSHISQSHIYGRKKIFERPGGEISSQLALHKIRLIVLPTGI